MTIDLDHYYDRVLSRLANEDAVVDFLNKPDILAKFNDEQREALLVKYLVAHGWEEIENPPEEQPKEALPKRNNNKKKKNATTTRNSDRLQ